MYICIPDECAPLADPHPQVIEKIDGASPWAIDGEGVDPRLGGGAAGGARGNGVGEGEGEGGAAGKGSGGGGTRSWPHSASTGGGRYHHHDDHDHDDAFGGGYVQFTACLCRPH
jgi:hypothetical protein